MERPPRVRQPHHEHPHLHPAAGDSGVELAEVDLGLRTRQMGLRHRHLDPVQPQLDLPPGDIPRDRHLGQARAVLGDQPLPDPPRGMPLLAWHLPISDQPAVDDIGIRVDRRPRPQRIRLARRRNRVAQRLADRPPMHPMPIRQLPDRHLLIVSPVPPDLLEQLHSRPHHSRPPRRRQRRTDPNQGGANIRDDTLHPPPTASPPRRGQHSRRTTTQPGPTQVTTLSVRCLSLNRQTGEAPEAGSTPLWCRPSPRSSLSGAQAEWLETRKRAKRKPLKHRCLCRSNENLPAPLGGVLGARVTSWTHL